MKIIHVTYTMEGGAGKAASRIHETLLELGKPSVLIVKNDQFNEKQSFIKRKIKSLIYRIKKKLNSYTHTIPEKFESKYCFFSVSERDVVKSDYILNKIEDGDVVILYWIGRETLNTATIRKIYKKNVKIFWFGLDMAPVTGGCHYFWDCQEYKKKCSNCPAILDKNQNRFAQKQLSIKTKNLKNIDIGLLASSDIGIEAMKQAAIKFNSYTKIPYPINTDVFTISNQISKENIYRIFFNAQNVNDIRKGWSYFKQYVIQLDRTLNDKKININVELISSSYKNHIEELSNLTCVKIIDFGWADDDKKLSKLYQQANLMICTSVEDLSPLMVNEALLCGVPVFGFDNASNREYIFENINGAIFKFGDISTMAERTIQHIQNRDLLKNKATIRNSILEIHQKETWFRNHFAKILNEE